MAQRYVITPEGMSPVTSQSPRPKPLMRSLSPERPGVPKMNVHKKCREEVRALVKEKEMMVAGYEMRLEEKEKTIWGLQEMLAVKEREVVELRRQNEYFRDVAGLAKDDLTTVLEGAEKKLNDAAEAKKNLRKKLDNERELMCAVLTVIRRVRTSCNAILNTPDEPSSAPLEEAELLETKVDAVVTILQDRVTEIAAAVRDLEQQLADLEEESCNQVNLLRDQLSDNNITIDELRAALASCTEDRKAEFKRLRESYERLLSSHHSHNTSPTPHRTHSPPKRNPKPWIPQGGGLLYD